MVSTLRVKSGGAWQGPIADGKLAVKVNGAWVYPASCSVKSGGAWRSTGYAGYPNNPGDPYVYAWDNNPGNVQAAWNYPAAGGAPISYYHVQLLNASGGLWAEENSTDNISPVWGIGQDARAQIRVRSVGVNGLIGPWTNLLKVGTGHPSTPNYGYVQRTRGWASAAAINGYGYWGNVAGVGVPSSILVNAIHWQLACHNYFSPMLSIAVPDFVEGGNRQINIMLNNDYVWQYNVEWPSPLDGWDYLQYWGNGGITGILCHGGGWWYSNPDPTFQVDGYVTVHGTEYYDNYEIVSWNPEAGNYYW
jgi:hypothetical protein